MLQISAQYGGRDGVEHIAPMHRALNQLSKQHMGGDYCKSLDTLAVIFRVAASVNDFEGGEGLENLQVRRKDKYISIDLVIPEARWRDLTAVELRAYVAKGVRECIARLIEAAESIGELTNKTALAEDFETVMSAFEADRD
jgi:hypothetical protein